MQRVTEQEALKELQVDILPEPRDFVGISFKMSRRHPVDPTADGNKPQYPDPVVIVVAYSGQPRFQTPAVKEGG